MNETEQQLQTEIIGVTSNDLLPETSFNIFKEKLVAYLQQLINNNFEQLVNLLYRLDVNEKKLKYILANANGEDAATIIANLIIERQLQKIESRRLFAQKNNNISEDEKW